MFIRITMTKQMNVACQECPQANLYPQPHLFHSQQRYELCILCKHTQNVQPETVLIQRRSWNFVPFALYHSIPKNILIYREQSKRSFMAFTINKSRTLDVINGGPWSICMGHNHFLENLIGTSLEIFEYSCVVLKNPGTPRLKISCLWVRKHWQLIIQTWALHENKNIFKNFRGYF